MDSVKIRGDGHVREACCVLRGRVRYGSLWTWPKPVSPVLDWACVLRDHGPMGFLRCCPAPFLALACATVAHPSTALGQRASFGPLTSEEGAPLQRISYTPMMEGADVVGPGEARVDVWLGFSNVFEQDSSATHVLFLDMERLISTIGLRWGVTASVEVGGRITLETTGPGALDAVILGWHNRLGFGNANRDRFPEGVYRQRLTDGKNRTFLDIPRTTLGFEDIRFFGKWRALESADRRSVLSLRTVARIPGDSNLAGDERGDVALMALGRLGMGAWYAHVMLGGATVRASPELAPILKDASAFFTLAFERSLGPHIAALVQFQTQSAILRSFDHRELDRAPTSLLFGLAGRWGDSWRWDASFQEDVPADTPAVDFTIGLRVSRTW